MEVLHPFRFSSPSHTKPLLQSWAAKRDGSGDFQRALPAALLRSLHVSLCFPAQLVLQFCSSFCFLWLVRLAGSPDSFGDNTPRPGLVSVKNIMISYKYPSLWTDDTWTLIKLYYLVYYLHFWCSPVSRIFAFCTRRRQNGLWVSVLWSSTPKPLQSLLSLW